MMQCGAERCSLMQCGAAVRCSLLQCAAACCRSLQWVQCVAAFAVGHFDKSIFF